MHILFLKSKTKFNTSFNFFLANLGTNSISGKKQPNNLSSVDYDPDEDVISLINNTNMESLTQSPQKLTSVPSNMNSLLSHSLLDINNKGPILSPMTANPIESLGANSTANSFKNNNNESSMLSLDDLAQSLGSSVLQYSSMPVTSFLGSSSASNSNLNTNGENSCGYFSSLSSLVNQSNGDNTASLDLMINANSILSSNRPASASNPAASITNAINVSTNSLNLLDPNGQQQQQPIISPIKKPIGAERSTNNSNRNLMMNSSITPPLMTTSANGASDMMINNSNGVSKVVTSPIGSVFGNSNGNSVPTILVHPIRPSSTSCITSSSSNSIANNTTKQTVQINPIVSLNNASLNKTASSNNMTAPQRAASPSIPLQTNSTQVRRIKNNNPQEEYF
jgi:hypothetical protein